MSLKGYQWLNDEGEVIMSFFFKDLTLWLWENVAQEELDKFVAFLKEKGNDHYRLEKNGCKIITEKK